MLVYMKIENIVLNVFESIQNSNVFTFSFLLHYICFMICILIFLISNVSANCFDFLVYLEDLIFTYRTNFSTKTKA